MIRIGVGITTRNRPEVLEVALKHFTTYRAFRNPWEQAIVQVVIIDDESTRENVGKNRDSVLKYFPDNWYHNWFQQRQGIAKAKNACLIALGKCDYYFLFDDDAFPQADGWAECYINTSQRTGVDHMVHMIPLNDLNPSALQGDLAVYPNSGGVMLFFTRKAIDTVGGYDPRFDKYGYEHSQISQRCNAAGLTAGFGPYVCPRNAGEYIYSIDFDLVHHGHQPPLADLTETNCHSSFDVERDKLQGYINYNAQFLGNAPIRIPLGGE